MEFEYNLLSTLFLAADASNSWAPEAAKLGKRALLVTGRSSRKKERPFGPRRRTAERRRRGKRRI